LIVPVGSGFARVSSKTFRSTALTSCGLFAVWTCYFKHLRSLYNKACIIHELPKIKVSVQLELKTSQSTSKFIQSVVKYVSQLSHLYNYVWNGHVVTLWFLFYSARFCRILCTLKRKHAGNSNFSNQELNVSRKQLYPEASYKDPVSVSDSHKKKLVTNLD
jgi:hypothetical protein